MASPCDERQQRYAYVFGSDAPRLIAELRRDDIVFAGVKGNAPGIDDLVARSVGEALVQDIRRRNNSHDGLARSLRDQALA
jgi:hypothetical protein